MEQDRKDHRGGLPEGRTQRCNALGHHQGSAACSPAPYLSLVLNLLINAGPDSLPARQLDISLDLGESRISVISPAGWQKVPPRPHLSGCHSAKVLWRGFTGGTKSTVVPVLPADIFLCAYKALSMSRTLSCAPELSFKSPPLSPTLIGVFSFTGKFDLPLGNVLLLL